jgi:hypothetical protein
MKALMEDNAVDVIHHEIEEDDVAHRFNKKMSSWKKS